MSSTIKLIIKSFRPLGCADDPGKGFLPRVLGSPGKAKDTQHPTGYIQHLSGSTHSSGLSDTAGRRHHLSPKLLIRFQWGFLHQYTTCTKSNPPEEGE